MTYAPFLRSLVGSGLTLFMMSILLVWVGPWLEVDTRSPRLRWMVIPAEKLVAAVRRVLPNMGPMDWSPVATLVGVWIVRLVLVQY